MYVRFERQGLARLGAFHSNFPSCDTAILISNVRFRNLSPAIPRRLSPPSRSSRSGSALLIVLGCVALLTILVTAFLITARTEFTTSNFYSKGVNTKLLSENVINLVEAQLREGARSTDVNTSAAVAWASQPGMVRTYDDTGNPYRYFKLYSWDNMIGTGAFDETQAAEMPPADWPTQPNVYTDLNEPVNGIYPILDPGAEGSVEGFSVTNAPGASSTDPLPTPVKWLYVLKDGTVTVGTPASGTAVSITNATAANPVIGRIAFWTDDETCKVNINTASEGIFWDAPIGQSTEELGNWNYDFTSPWGFTCSVPSSEEYQRMPGHPAMTCLSPVFGFGSDPVLPVTGLEGPLQWPLTAATYSSTFGPYFSLTPRLQAGGSMGGAQPSGGVVQGVQSPFTVPGYRLYDSVDELAFDPSRTPMSVAGPDTLYPAINGASPSGRSAIAELTPQVIDQRRFFLTAHSRAPEETLFGTPRISLWPLQAQTEARTAKDNLLAFCSTINNQPYYFQRATYYEYQKNAASGVVTNPSIPSSQSTTADFPGAPTSTLVDAGTASLGNVARNENLYAYLQALTSAKIPGFGGNFLTKYPGAGGVTDRDEILTEMFDMIRSGVNTFDVANNIYPHYNYTPWAISGNDDPGAGTTVPISISNGTQGLGRNYSVAEVALVFIASQMDLAPASAKAGTVDANNRMSIGPGLPWAYPIDYPSTTNPPTYLSWDTSPPAPVPPATTSALAGYHSYYLQNGQRYSSVTNAPISSTTVTIGDPQTTQVQAFLIVRPYGVMPGPPLYRPNIRIRITDLNQLTLNGNNLGFPAASEAVAVINTANNTSSTTQGGLFEALLGHGGNNQGNPPWNNDGTQPTTNYNYPFVSQPVTVPAAYPSPYGGEDEPSLTNNASGSGVAPPAMVQIHQLANGNAYAGSTMSVGGTQLKIEVLDGVNPMSTAQTLQTVYVNIPNMTLPVPSVERANGTTGAEACTIGGTNGNTQGGANVAASGQPYQAAIARVPGYGGTPSGAPAGSPTSLAYYYQLTFNPMVIANRFVNDITSIINRGDVVRSFVVNPVSPTVGGDMRMLVANPNRPSTNGSGSLTADDFVPLGMERSTSFYNSFSTQGPAYGSPASLFIRQLHSLLTDQGRTFGISLLQTSQIILQEPYGILDDGLDLNQGAGMGETAGALIQEPGLTVPPSVATEIYDWQSAPVVTPELNGAFMDPTTQKIPGDWTLGLGIGWRRRLCD